ARLYEDAAPPVGPELETGEGHEAALPRDVGARRRVVGARLHAVVAVVASPDARRAHERGRPNEQRDEDDRDVASPHAEILRTRAAWEQEFCAERAPATPAGLRTVILRRAHSRDD